MFSSAPDFETPADAGGDNEYMVTVKAEAGGEEEMVGITINVTDVAEHGTLEGDTNVTYAERPHRRRGNLRGHGRRWLRDHLEPGRR